MVLLVALTSSEVGIFGYLFGKSVGVLVQRIATTESSASTGLFVQLELSDFSRIGSNPLDILKKSVQGYSLINQPASGALPAQ